MAETLTPGHSLRKYDTGDNPGAANLNANWTDIDRRLVGVGTVFPTIYPISALFLRKDQNKLYENTGTEATPVWTVALDGSGGAAANFLPEIFTVGSNGQTVFALAQTYVTGGLVILSVNGVQYMLGTDFTISGTTLTWLDTPFTLEIGDTIIVTYEHA